MSTSNPSSPVSASSRAARSSALCAPSATTTERLFELAEFLAQHEVTHVAMEATGVYWRPVWHILDPEGLQLVLGNAAHIRNVPGRKSDTNDAMWLADLMAHGLIRPSFVPPTQVELEEQLSPFRQAADLLETMPGIGPIAAEVILAEIGPDMQRFPTAGHLRSWAGLCPRMDESAGKKRSTRIRKGAPWLKTTLLQAAWAAVRTKNSYYKALYGSVKRSSGSANKAIVAVAAAMLTSAYYMLLRGEPYRNSAQIIVTGAIRLAWQTA